MTTDAASTASQSPTTPLVSERDMLGALEVLATADADPTVLAILSDEEILGIDGEEGLAALGSPYLDNATIDRETAGATAIRSLITRGLVHPSPEGRENEGDMVLGEGDPARRVIQLDRTFAGLLTLRRIPEAMVIAARTSSQITTTLGVHLFPDDGVLEEFVAADGFHHFSVPTADVIADRLLEFVDPHGAAAADGEVQEVTTESLAAMSELEDTRTLSVLTTAGRGAGRQTTVFALADRVLLLDHGSIAETEEPSSEATMSISEVSRESLRDLLGVLVSEVDVEDDDEETAPPA